MDASIFGRTALVHYLANEIFKDFTQYAVTQSKLPTIVVCRRLYSLSRHVQIVTVAILLQVGVAMMRSAAGSLDTDARFEDPSWLQSRVRDLETLLDHTRAEKVSLQEEYVFPGRSARRVLEEKTERMERDLSAAEAAFRRLPNRVVGLLDEGLRTPQSSASQVPPSRPPQGALRSPPRFPLRPEDDPGKWRPPSPGQPWTFHSSLPLFEPREAELHDRPIHGLQADWTEDGILLHTPSPIQEK